MLKGVSYKISKLYILVLCFIFLYSCSKNVSSQYKTSNENVPIINMKMTSLIDVDSVSKTDAKSLIPSTLKLGIDHSVVMNIQEKLMAYGFMEEDKASTYYGETTESAIKKLERQLGLTQDGICSKEIYNLLMSSDCPTYDAKRGYRGEDIAMLQQQLYELGYLLYENDVSGYYGEKTESAVKDLQKNNSLNQTGEIDLKTYKMMYSDNVSGYVINKDSKASIIKMYQEKLKNLGYYMGACDGKYTDQFRESVRLYQSMNSQQTDGFINPSTKFSIDSIYAKPYIIYIGDKSDKIKTIQLQLVILNYIEPKLATGYYGEYTAQAVAYFQKLNSLPITGLIDGTTQEKIFSGDAIFSKNPIKYSSQFIMKTEDIIAKKKENKYKGNADDLIRVATLKLGSKYVWGMKGPKVFDCSGFVYWCLNQVGVEVQYMTTYNWRFTTQFEKVEKFDDLKTGDLVIINGHMGIVADNMTIIDASSSNGKVVHRQLDDWWREKFLIGFRIFDDNTN